MLPYVYAQPIIFYVLLLWGVLCTALVTFSSGYFVGRKTTQFQVKASLVAWIINVPIGTAMILHCTYVLDLR